MVLLRDVPRFSIENTFLKSKTDSHCNLDGYILHSVGTICKRDENGFFV